MGAGVSHHYYTRNGMEARPAAGTIKAERFGTLIYGNAGRLSGMRLASTCLVGCVRARVHCTQCSEDKYDIDMIPTHQFRRKK